MTLAVGNRAPEFELIDTAGAQWSVDGDAASATVIVFTCNHCPYALAWHDRIARVARDYADRGVRFLAINSNDADRYPRDSYEAMRTRVAAEDWPMPYLHDATQEVARAYGARRLRICLCWTPAAGCATGARRTPTTTIPARTPGGCARHWTPCLQVSTPRGHTRAPVGCSIKWKQ